MKDLPVKNNSTIKNAIKALSRIDKKYYTIGIENYLKKLLIY
jgi:hypothetical protein